jgi:ABC-type Mn2+/Zn2+ transport system ATPase subunit
MLFRHLYCRFYDKNGNVIARTMSLPGSASLFLFGPRGTGKSTWIGSVLVTIQYFLHSTGTPGHSGP